MRTTNAAKVEASEFKFDERVLGRGLLGKKITEATGHDELVWDIAESDSSVAMDETRGG
jgi:hypothetical protein